MATAVAMVVPVSVAPTVAVAVIAAVPLIVPLVPALAVVAALLFLLLPALPPPLVPFAVSARPGASCCGPSLSPCARGFCRPCPSRDGSPCGRAAEEGAPEEREVPAAARAEAEAEQVVVAGSPEAQAAAEASAPAAQAVASVVGSSPCPSRCRAPGSGSPSQVRGAGAGWQEARTRRALRTPRSEPRTSARKHRSVPPAGAAACAEPGRMSDRELNGVCPSSARSSDGTPASTLCGASPSRAARHRYPADIAAATSADSRRACEFSTRSV